MPLRVFLGKCLLDARILQRNCSAVHFPHLSSLDYCLLLKVKLPPLPDVICNICNISVTVFKGKTSDVVILEQIPDPFRPFSHALEQLLYLSSIMQITLARK